MPADPRLAALPALRKLAEEEARVRQEALAAAWPSMNQCPPPTWVSMSEAEREYLIAVELALLSDLSRPASRRAVADLVAEAVPNVQAWEVTAGCECGGSRLNMVLRACGLPELSRWEPDPAPAEALTLIALAVLS